MAELYVRSDGSNTSPYETWAKAATTLATAMSAAAAGDTIYVADGHAESQASSMTLTSPGTAASPLKVICVDDTGDPEPPTAVATGATVDTTGSNSIDIVAGFTYYYGLSLRTGVTTPGSGADLNIFTTAVSQMAVFEDCTLSIGASSGAFLIILSPLSSSYNDTVCVFYNTNVTFGNVGSRIFARAKFRWLGGTLTGSQTDLFNLSSTAMADVVVDGVDLSAMGSGDFLVDPGSLTDAMPSTFLFNNCKLGASVSLSDGNSGGPGGPVIELINCDSGDTNYRHEYSDYMGDMTTETTLVRTGGASDGTTTISWQIDTTANSEFIYPFKTPWVTGWINTTGSKTWTAHILHDSATNLQDDEVWLEVEYLGTSGFPQSIFADDRAADILATPADQAASSETWTTTGMTNPNEQACAVTATVNEIGPFRARLCVAKPSYTTYFCPLIEIS